MHVCNEDALKCALSEVGSYKSSRCLYAGAPWQCVSQCSCFLIGAFALTCLCFLCMLVCFGFTIVVNAQAAASTTGAEASMRGGAPGGDAAADSAGADAPASSSGAAGGGGGGQSRTPVRDSMLRKLTERLRPERCARDAPSPCAGPWLHFQVAKLK
jgi:hypothetical protein